MPSVWLVVETTILTLVGLAACALTIFSIKNWQGDRYLCDTCRFNLPEACHKMERPRALICAAFEQGQPEPHLVTQTQPAIESTALPSGEAQESEQPVESTGQAQEAAPTVD